MRFYTPAECEEWLSDRKRVKPDEVEGCLSLRVPYPAQGYQYFYFARWIATNLIYRDTALLWIIESGIWPSSENWHLYYKLRHTHGDQRLLHEAPGHFFLGYEAEELTSFLQVAMLNGWGGYLLTQLDYANVFFSHDEFLEFYSRNPNTLDDIKEALSEKDANSKK